MSLYQIMYISSAQGAVSADQCAAIARAAGVRNRMADVTGLLLFNGKRFIQVLEGPRPAVESAYERICRDERHRGVVKLRESVIDEREFGSWGMAYDDPARPSDSLKDKVAALLDQANASTRAHFIGSAEMHRR
ncbi:Photopigment and puc expression activator [Sphingobium herbicidovorans NBRC 16415]|uniref:Photopigment and puc expression activator n=1 Tax=Sphingobium herbicidovorans (strain ATCC 700291 / DSM 11019 / CCUG 56400 / KCTC 2939 / LMG 18315 / NBRC 16415 / MH) TaxID=1219045 RepID=A0A086P8J4_SPHHM|nr:BLUF domain-containing protein [Sphingobium herbicidovorans]KFG89712.1 Photopigment and puc expression activator [Sphingobium herbicidovorans NBRC 16415]